MISSWWKYKFISQNPLSCCASIYCSNLFSPPNQVHLLHCCVFVNTCAYNLSSVYRSSARQLHLFITRAHFSPSFVAHHLNASCFTNNAVVSPCTSPILCTDNMVNTTVIDGRGHLLGRLASTVAKELLNGTVSTALHYGSSHRAQEKKVKKGKNREEKKKMLASTCIDWTTLHFLWRRFSIARSISTLRVHCCDCIIICSFRHSCTNSLSPTLPRLSFYFQKKK